MKCVPGCACGRHKPRTTRRGWPKGKPRGPQTQEHRDKTSEASRRLWAEADEDLRERMTNGWPSGKPRGPMSEDHKTAISEGFNNLSDEEKEAHREASRVAASKPKSESFKAKLSEIASRRVAEGTLGPGTSKPAFSKPELQMAGMLEEAGIEYDPQHRIGTKVADFWLPDTRTVIEVDGVYWHSRSDPDGSKSRERDEYLLKNGVSHVIHVTDKQLACEPELQEVVPNVRSVRYPSN